MYDQKQVVVINGKKFAVWEKTVNDHDVETLECVEITAECPICGCVSADKNPFSSRVYLNGKKKSSEFIELNDKTIICRDCANESGDYYVCACCETWHKGKAAGENKYGESLCDECHEYGKKQMEKEKRYASYL
jgi:hypothetical protein